LVSGSFEALLYDGLIAVEGQDHFGRVFGWVTGAGLFAQIPAALAATVLFGGGGYPLVGWVSVGCCLASSALASQLPDARPIKTGDPEPEPDGYLAVLRAGITEAAVHAGVRAAVLAVAALAGLDGIDEYFSLIAHDWGVTTALVPLAVLAIPLGERWAQLWAVWRTGWARRRWRALSFWVSRPLPWPARWLIRPGWRESRSSMACTGWSWWSRRRGCSSGSPALRGRR